MTIPPFPSQDLAKLVLGYLAEEQLMTTYDEFLQASPYLDALQNEYDRIFMTSLKSILAEYRAVKIFVETCKPLLLRKMIFQCTNLLDVVKLLVSHVDLNKIQSHESFDKHGAGKHHSNSTNRTITCESCISLKLSSCVCTSKLKTQALSNQSSQIDDSSIQTSKSVEATSLIDLPGNHVTTRKKQIKVLDKDSVYFSDCQTSSVSHDSLSNNHGVENNRSNSIQSTNSNQLKRDLSTVSLNSTVKDIESTESRKKIEEFDSVLKSIVDKNNTVAGSGIISNNRVSNASTFQDFASGVSAGREHPNSNVPDSSTSESLGVQAPLTKDYYKDNAIGSQIYLQVSHRNNEIDLKTVKSVNIPKYTKIITKPEDQKVKILSDVKVIKPVKNATSTPLTTTPLMQMQSIVINGTPAYTHTPVASHMFTKDEIMAMPTLIVVPASGSQEIPTNAQGQPILPLNCNVTTNESSSSQSLGPLVIDLPPPPDLPTQPEENKKLTSIMPISSEPGLVKTVDFKNASVPKDNSSCVSKTPQGLPPVRKSSSTPRRSSTHVRVLDFTTPRRILHETINEQAPEQASQAPAEVVISSSPNISFNNTVAAQNPIVNSNTSTVQSTSTVPNTDSCDTDTGSAKENTSQPIVPFKKCNWDAELRALVAKETNLGCTGKFKKSSKKKKASEKFDKTNKKTPKTNASTSKIKKTPKKRRKVVELEEEVPVADEATKPDASVKPTINIITTTKKESCEDVLIIPETKKTYELVKNEDNAEEDDCLETPEADRLSLQNVIGARLNISDLLETPYKQALYDIQMGTPKFLPDLPGEPLSDIKITNIPTPRFLDTPKPMQATPSSWSSRPTDYSSGGSYYKPDDQDYLPIPDLRCVVSSSSKEDTTLDKSIEIVKDDEKKTRPQRQCTKNVSYYRFASATNKAKEADDTLETVSTCSDSIDPIYYKNNEPVVKTPRDRSKANKSETKRKIPAKRRKSPAVKDKLNKSSVKVKPRHTPTKLTPCRSKKKLGTPGYNTPNKYRRNTNKDKNVDVATLEVAAPTKSRRKSSTPRKINCGQPSSSHTSSETPVKVNSNVSREVAEDSETEQLTLRWSDDGSQDTKSNKDSPPTLVVNDCEDIYQIQKYIQNTDSSRSQSMPQESHPSFQADLMKRGFDIETAKIIERDLLDASGSHSKVVTNEPSTAETAQAKNTEPPSEKPVAITSDVKVPEQSMPEDTDGEEDVVFSSYECNEDSKNFIVVEHDDTKEMPQAPPIKLKETFAFDICIDDDLTVRLKAPPFSLLLDEDPSADETIGYSYKETQMAVSSIINMDRLYTPHKDSYKTQCFEIFDSTLTSLDTPLKACSPRRLETSSVTTVTDIVLEEVQKEKGADDKKRKRSSSSDESTSDTKKTKYLLTSESIQNIDIESVLTKLHGP